jgi:3-hydroxyacyl-CoA dehydrogenase
MDEHEHQAPACRETVGQSEAAAQVILLGDRSDTIDRLWASIRAKGRGATRVTSVAELPANNQPSLIIESITGPTDARAHALHQLEHRITGDYLLASTGSPSLLAPLSESLHRPDRLCMIHLCGEFGSPVFAEICTAACYTTSAEATGRLAELTGLLESGGYTAVRVHRKSFVEHVALRYMLEGLALLGEGVSAGVIERAAINAGMRAGPLAMIDLYSLSRIDQQLHAHDGSATDHHHGHHHDHAHGHDHHHHHDHAHDHHHHHDHGCVDSGTSGDDHEQLPMTQEAIYVLEKMAHGFERYGVQAGRGFYEYEDGEDPGLWPGLKVFERRRNTIPHEDVRDRLILIQALEARRCLAMGIVGSQAEADRGSILGWGFPAAGGGVISGSSDSAFPDFRIRAEDLAARYGLRFTP